jgi:hypothetical protein
VCRGDHVKMAFPGNHEAAGAADGEDSRRFPGMLRGFWRIRRSVFR